MVRSLPRRGTPVTAIAAVPAAGSLASWLPCGACVKADVCRLRELIPADAAGSAVRVLERGLRLVALEVRVECDHFLGQAAAPAPLPASPAPEDRPSDADRAARSRRNGTEASLRVRQARREELAAPSRPIRARPGAKLPQEPVERDRVLFAAVRDAGGDQSAAGRALGVTQTRVSQLLRAARDAGRLPDDVAQLLASRSRNGRPKGVPA